MTISRNWIITLNNPDGETGSYLEKMFQFTGARYIVGQKEVGAQGTPHIQAFLNFRKPVRPAVLKRYDERLHIEKVKRDNGASTYCEKEDGRLEGPFKFGEYPVRLNDSVDWEKVRDQAKKGDFDEIPAHICVRHYSNLRLMAKDNLHFQAVDKKAYWIWGPTGVGKSHSAANDYGGPVYPKMANKWWDSYKDEPVVVLNDLGKDHHMLGYHLKLWADKWPIPLEVKNGAVANNYTTFIVTSQYPIEDIFRDPETSSALLRRFTVVHIPFNLF